MSDEPKPLTLGRIVHVRIGGDDDAPVLRPAIVVAVWSDSCANLQVFLDGLNDVRNIERAAGTPVAFAEEGCRRGLTWATSVLHGEDVGDWRWPAR